MALIDRDKRPLAVITVVLSEDFHARDRDEKDVFVKEVMDSFVL
jgi:hypothetical protein